MRVTYYVPGQNFISFFIVAVQIFSAWCIIDVSRGDRPRRQGEKMGWSNYSHYGKDYYDSEGNDLRGGADEYYVTYCDYCDERTEHDRCTDDCVECS